MSSYLKNADPNSQKEKVSSKVGVGSSRNQALAAPAGTRKDARSMAFGVSSGHGETKNKSVTGNRLY